MADNNDLKVIVGLNIPKSVVEIEDDLKIIEKTLANSDEGKLKITAGLNVGKTIGIINKQLSELKIDGSRLKITPTIDINTNNIKTSDISRSLDFDKITKYIKQEFGYAKGMTKQSTDEIKQELMSISETFGREPAKFEASFNKIWNIFQSYGNKIRKSKAERDADIQNVIDQYGFAPIKNIQANSKLQGKDPNISKYWYDRVVDAFGDENEARKAIKTVFGYIKVGVEGELKASMHKLDELFGEYKDRVTGQVYANGGADGFRQYYEDLMKARSWTKNKSFVDTTNDDYQQATLRELIEKSLGLVNANNQLVQSNQQVAQSERDVAQAQREVNNATQSASANNSNELLKKKEELANKLLASENNVLAIEKQLATQGQELTRLRAQEAEVFPFGEEADQLNRQIQEAQSRYNATKQMLDNENSTHTALNEQLNAILGQIEQEKQRINQSTQNMGSASGNGIGISSEYLSSNISKITVVTNSAKEAEQSFKNLLASMGDTKGTVVSKEFADAAGKVNSFTVAVKSGTGAFETFKYSIDDKNGGFKLDNITAANSGIERLKQSTEKYKATVEATIKTSTAFVDKLKADWSDTNGGRSVKDAEHVADLNKRYDELIKTINSLRDADNIAAKDISANIKVQKTQLSSLITAYHNAEKVATSLRAKDTDSSIINIKNNIQKFMNELGASKVSFSSIHDELEKLALAMQELDKAASGDKASKLREVLNAFDNVKSKFDLNNTIARNFDDVDTKVKTLIADLNKINNAQIFKTHGADSNVVAFRNEIGQLSTEAKDFKAQLDALSQSGTKVIPDSLRSQINDLIAKFESAKQKNLQLQDGLRNNDAWSQISSRVQRLTAQIKEYMATNTKAAKKYSGQFDGLLSGLSQAEINKDSEAVRRLSADFQILRSQIKAAGDTGKTMFQTFVDGAKRFSMWFSITANVSRAIRTFKQMISTVREIDTAMTALKRVTDETESSYARFLKNTAKEAQRLHTTIDSLTTQITEWVKLGNDLDTATKLAEVSMMYSKVGDVDDETAVKDLVATMKAFEIEAQNATDIVSALDQMNNRYATSAKDLGEGLRVASSSMSAAGNSFEKTLAMLTGGTEITQNANAMALGMRTVALRIRNMKGALQELNEEYEDLESISKIQTQILNLSGVNIFDPNGNFRDTYDILKDISEVYNDLADKDKASLDTILFGTTRSNQGQALLKAFQSGQIQKALKDIENSAGTAEAEFAKYEQSIEAESYLAVWKQAV